MLYENIALCLSICPLELWNIQHSMACVLCFTVAHVGALSRVYTYIHTFRGLTCRNSFICVCRSNECFLLGVCVCVCMHTYNRAGLGICNQHMCVCVCVIQIVFFF